MTTDQIYNKISQLVYSTNETQRNSFDSAKYVCENNIEGAIVECGVAAGGNFASMMLGVIDSNTTRQFIGFDSFEGIQLAGPNDLEQPGIGKINHDVNVGSEALLQSSGITSHSLNSVLSNLERLTLLNRMNVSFYEGWIQHTLPKVIDQIGPIAILRLDMDIYEPTKVALQYLFKKVSKGGIVIIDDWALSGARLACEEYFSEIDYQPKYQLVKNSTPVWFYKK